MNLEGLSEGAKLKGLDLLGTGDITHPVWLGELKQKLQDVSGSGLFKFNDIYFMLTGEVSTIFTHEIKTKKVHHVIHIPNFDTAEQINDILKKWGRLNSDGRPMLTVSAPEFVESVMNINKDVFIYPAHAWTPWFSVFGSKSGFNSMEECYQDQIKHIHALETGLSSDPPMNWRLSSLDKFALLSNSDSHSPNAWRLGREANIFELKKITFDEIHNVIKEKDGKRFLFTIETSPFYGKYHFDGHRACGISMEPKESKKYNGYCPVCKKKLTIGVLNRIEELADRPEGYKPDNAMDYKSLLPLYEIISFVTGVNQLYNKKVIEQQAGLIKRFGNELKVLLEVPLEELIKVTNEEIAEAIIKVRESKVKYVAGYDGVYGRPVFDESEFKKIEEKLKAKAKEQRSLKDFKK